MSEPSVVEARVLMTQVAECPRSESGTGQIFGEIESAGVSVGWNRATLSPGVSAALRDILERSGGVERTFELQHGSLVLLRCRMLPGGPRTQISFDGSLRRRAR
jgi:hypothetical protein